MTPVRTVKYRFSDYMLLIHSELLNKHLCMQSAPTAPREHDCKHDTFLPAEGTWRTRVGSSSVH